ncbi:hypothetical protein CV102_11345 [Natronococcus pandeyae]|uniref:Uncharacterized protein n=1 Tax=Natronococcus pandeyae TaxID=2055836 RepID=A0A8J8Q664_9EURY|nr:hypothetical protein [Natronococcus pandeyae]TYL38399.1 hypothetical protein CV102_11345 [Natronococcus pandeyae]
MTDDRRSSTRRGVLAASSSLATLCLAGCLDDGSDGGESDDDDGLDDRLDDDIEEEDFDDDLSDEFDEGDHEVDVSELLLYDRESDEQVANAHAGHWHYETETGGLPVLEPGSAIELETVFTKDGEELPLGADEASRLEVSFADDAPADVVSIDAQPDYASLTGEEAGETAVVFQLVEDDEIVWEAPPIDAFVE